MKAFRDYILHSKVIAFVPSSTIKDILVQAGSEGRRGKWISKLQEYDFEIKPTKLVKGQGLTKLLATSAFDLADENHMNPILSDTGERNPQEPSGNPQEPLKTPQEPPHSISPYFRDSAWYKDIIFYLQNLQCPPDMEKSRYRSLKLKSLKYCILQEKLYWKDPGGILLDCINEV